MHTWDPDQYLEYGDERGRPFVDLVSRIGAPDPGTVVDLGCGPGNLTGLLKQRWPAAAVTGIDASPEMIARADVAGVRFEVGDLRDWQPSAPVDVLVSNATLQWVPEHLDLLPRLLQGVSDDGWFAFQVPGNFEAPTHTIRRDLADDARFAPYLQGVEAPHAFGPGVYLDRLLDEGCAVDAWETTYLHVLSGQEPVFAWVAATGARPTIQALPEGVRQEFEAEFRARLDGAYPVGPSGAVMPFRRVFVVARKGAA